jgi:dTDP-L-rhamnose 4-epimerase
MSYGRRITVRVLVTGGAGFIGSHVVAHLRSAGHEVVALDLLHPAAHRVQAMPDGGLKGDIRDPDVVTSALRGVDAVVHQAAMVGMGVDLDDMPEYVSCNDFGTAVLLAGMARAGVTRLVLASSMVVYGEGRYACATHGDVRPAPRTHADLTAGRFEPTCPACSQPLAPALVSEDAPTQPRSVYAASKLAQEHLTGVWARESNATAIALRYHNVYGPGMPRDTPYAGVAAIFRSSLERGEPARVFEDGAQRRDFVHVADVARANVAALAAVTTRSVTTRSVTTRAVTTRAVTTRDEGGFRAYNVASGEPHTVGEMAEALSAAFGGPPPTVTGEFRAGDVRHVVASPERARRELGFTASVSFHDGMKEFATAPLRG